MCKVRRINQYKETDADGSGGLSVTELAAKLKISEAEARSVVSEYDRDGDGELQLEEFAEAMQQRLEKNQLGAATSASKAAELARLSAALARDSQGGALAELEKIATARQVTRRGSKPRLATHARAHGSLLAASLCSD